MSERERLRRAEEIFFCARRLSLEQRGAWLREQCGDDRALEREVRSLLESDRGQRSFLETPAVELELGSALAPDHALGTTVGNYLIVRHIGEGGFGRVYLAEQVEPVRRRVALKILKPGLGSRRSLARFQFELQTLARMEHPGIARVLEAGSTADGRPYYAMDYVAGVPLLDYCETRALDLRARLALFVRVSEAVQHAHARGVIHRDLKPSNVLVVERDGTAQPVVIDFGVAKSLEAVSGEQPLATEDGLVVGTLEYMSPEQARGRRDEVDIRSDVYSLGVMLYELCTGARPHDLAGQTPLDATRTIADSPVVRPSERKVALRGDLETVLLKALEKDPAARYATAAALIEDVQRFLERRAILAHPPSVLYLVARFSRRNRVLVAAIAAASLALVIGVVGLGRGVVLATRASAAARSEQAKAETLGAFLLDMLQQVDPAVAQGRDVTMLEVLDGAQARLEGNFSGPPEVEATLRASFGEALRRLGHFDEARTHLEKALELDRGALGPEHRSTLRATYLLAELDADQGRLDSAEKLLRASLAGQERTLGPRELETLDSAAALGAVLARSGRAEEALDSLQRALAGFVEKLGESDARTARARSKLGGVLLDLGREREAEEALRSALDAQRAASSEHHPDVGDTHRALARVLERTGRVEAAIGECGAALASYAAVLGPDHDASLACQRDLVLLYRHASRLRDADREAHRLTLLCGIRFGMDSREMRDATRLMGEVFLAQGRLGEAERLLRTDLEWRRNELGGAEPSTAESALSVATLLARQGELDSADTLAARALADLETALPAGDLRLLRARTRVGEIQLARESYADAEKALEGVPEALTGVLGAQHPDVLAAWAARVATLARQGRGEEAESAAEGALAGVEVATQDGLELGCLLLAAGEVSLERGDVALARTRLARAASMLERRCAGDPEACERLRQALARAER